jgi:agmatinase
MSYTRLYISPSFVFSGQSIPFEEADYVVVGVPFDFTSTYRPGSKFGPLAIRNASLNVETYSMRTEIDVSEIKVCDLGDLHVAIDAEETLKRLKLVVEEIAGKKKTPIILGGEHTIAVGAVKAFKSLKKLAILDFDAHMDLRQEYLGAKTMHATCMRRICDLIGPENVIQVGVRDVSNEEIVYAKKNGLSFFTATQVSNAHESMRKIIVDRLSGYEHIYVTVDMDVLDPSYAPAVGNPASEGINPSVILDMLQEVCGKFNVIGFDLVEVAPYYDSGITAIQAAHIIFEMLCFLEKSKRSKP